MNDEDIENYLSNHALHQYSNKELLELHHLVTAPIQKLMIKGIPAPTLYLLFQFFKKYSELLKKDAIDTFKKVHADYENMRRVREDE